MATNRKPPCEVLKELWERTGLSGIEVAQRAGYKASSSFYALTQPRKQGNRKIPHESIMKLIPVMRGLGNPPVTIDELLAISDAATETPAVARHLRDAVTGGADTAERVAETGGDLLPIRLRAERGVYVDPASTARRYGVSCVGATPDYPVTAQFVVLVVDEHAMPMYRRMTQLHAVHPKSLSLEMQVGKRVVVYAGSRDGLSEVVVGRFVRLDETTGAPVLETAAGEALSGTVAAVVVGAYSRETNV